MGRRGTVAAIHGDMVAIATDDDGLTVVEVSGWDVELGDDISWVNDYGLGSEVYENRTKRSRDEVYVQDHSMDHQTFVKTYCR